MRSHTFHERIETIFAFFCRIILKCYLCPVELFQSYLEVDLVIWFWYWFHFFHQRAIVLAVPTYSSQFKQKKNSVDISVNALHEYSNYLLRSRYFPFGHLMIDHVRFHNQLFRLHRSLLNRRQFPLINRPHIHVSSVASLGSTNTNQKTNQNSVFLRLCANTNVNNSFE